MTRTDTNYVNITMTPVTYCPLAASVLSLKGCIEAGKNNIAGNINATANKLALDRLDTANQNLN